MIVFTSGQSQRITTGRNGSTARVGLSRLIYAVAYRVLAVVMWRRVAGASGFKAPGFLLCVFVPINMSTYDTFRVTLCLPRGGARGMEVTYNFLNDVHS